MLSATDAMVAVAAGLLTAGAVSAAGWRRPPPNRLPPDGRVAKAATRRCRVRSFTSVRLRRTSPETELISVLEQLGASLRSGASLRTALGDATQLDGVLARSLAGAVDSLDGGATVVDAIGRWATDPPDSGSLTGRGRAQLAAAITIGHQLGGSVAPAIDGLAVAARTSAEAAGEARSLAVQATMSAAVLALLPTGVAVLLAAADPAQLRFLTSTGAGRAIAASGVGLQLLGWVWSRRIIAGALR